MYDIHQVPKYNLLLFYAIHARVILCPMVLRVHDLTGYKASFEFEMA